MLTTFFADIEDFRRPQGQRYELDKILLLSVIALLCNAKSYRDISRFIKNRFGEIKTEFGLEWKRPPAYTTIRNIIQGICKQEMEAAFRAFTQHLTHYKPGAENLYHFSVDGKTLRRSFDHFEDQKAIQKLMFFDRDQALILGHELIDDKSNEIPAFQKLLKNLEIPCGIFSADALHCQKKLLSRLLQAIMQCWYSLKIISQLFWKMCCVFKKHSHAARSISKRLNPLMAVLHKEPLLFTQRTYLILY